MTHWSVHLLGYPQLRRDGAVVELGLRKGLALIAYLAEARAPVARDALCALLWPEMAAEAGRARLRRTVHKLRATAGEALIEADRDTLHLAAADTDTSAFEHAASAGALAQAAAAYEADFLDGFAVPGCPAFDEWMFFRCEALRSRLFQVLERLAQRSIADGRPREAAVQATRLLALDPLSEASHRLLIEAHLASGDRAGAERQYAECARRLREELGVEPEAATLALLGTPGERSRPVRYAESAGLHIAYQTVGSGDLDLMFVPGFVSHLERGWDEPRLARFLSALGRGRRLILFDRRGVGLSDRVGAAPTVEATARDMMAVLRAVRSPGTVLFGASEGGPGCVQLAAEHPEMLRGMVLYGSLAKGSSAADYPCALTHAQYDQWLRRLVGSWGGPAEIETFAPSMARDVRARAWWAGLLRAASSPGAVRGILEALRDVDVRPLLPRVRVPSLVLHRRGDRAVRAEVGRRLAAGIPGARFVELAGADHWAWAGDVASVLEAVEGFIAALAPRRRSGALQ
jgi:DNA-binding SARP family transcriptional activator/pimeloyl-ACP methyl ester carboxylesterase